MRVKFIDCSEKYHGDIDKIVNFLSSYFDSLGIESRRLKLNDLQIAKCTQCRCCTQKKSESPVKCVIKDDLNNALDKIEDSDRFVILADRTNLFTKNKIHEKFSERLVAYYYWPYGQVQSKLRRVVQAKSSILINYNTTKYFMNHSFYTTKVYMEQTSTSLGAKVVDWQVITPKENITKAYEKRLLQMANRLIESFAKVAS